MSMALKEKLKWDGHMSSHAEAVREARKQIASTEVQKVTLYWFVGKNIYYALECFVEGNRNRAKESARGVVDAVLLYFYGSWRNTLMTPDGKVGQKEWKPFCLWYDEVLQSLPFAAALSDWDSVARIAGYPPEDKLPEATKARGETAWGWALITYLRNEPREKIEAFIQKAEDHKARRPKLLCPVLRALMDENAAEFQKTLKAYLEFYRKSEFERLVTKIVSLDGTTLYHLGRRYGMIAELPVDLAEHIIRFE